MIEELGVLESGMAELKWLRKYSITSPETQVSFHS
jgi:hypothetical protein